MENKLIKKLEALTGKKVVLENMQPKVDLALSLLPVEVQSELSASVLDAHQSPREVIHRIAEYLNDYDRDNQLGETAEELTQIAKLLMARWKFSEKKTDLQETTADGNYTTEEMERFLINLGSTIDFANTRITIPSNYPSSSVTNSKETMLAAWEKAKKNYANDPSVKWYIWSLNVGGSLNKPTKIGDQRFDLNSILSIATKYPDSVRGLNLGVLSNTTNGYDKKISTQGD